MAKKGQTITRYSHNPLAKKFKCPKCGNWFRSLQGLSGHVRFRHGIYEQQQDIVDRLIEVKKREDSLEAFCRASGLPQQIVQGRLQVMRRWADLLTYCDSFGITLGFDDFKKYVVASFEKGEGR